MVSSVAVGSVCDVSFAATPGIRVDLTLFQT